MNNTKLNYFFSQPHQIFFVFGVVNAAIFMLVFMLSFKGVITLTITANIFHAYSSIFAIFTPIFLGFLLTTFPRFSQTPPLEMSIYITCFTLLATGIVLFLIGSAFWSFLVYIGMLFVLGALIYTMILFYLIFRGSPSPDLYDQLWIIIGFGGAIVSSLLFFIGVVSDVDILLSLAKLIGIYLFLTTVALTVAQRMIPFFSHVMIKKNKKLIPIVYTLLVLNIISEVFGLNIGFIALFIAGVFLAKEIYSWKLPFKNSESILWILHLALFWLPLSLIISSFSSLAEIVFDKNFIFLTIHLVMLGFLTTVLIGFVTRVTLGHSGNNMVIDTQTKMLFYATQVLVLTRALYSYTGSNILFDLSSLIWFILFITWSVKYLPVLIFGKKIT